MVEKIKKFVRNLYGVEQRVQHAAEKKGHELAEEAGHIVHDVENAIGRQERKIFNLATNFFRMEASGGILLVIAAIAAIIIANSPLASLYHYIFGQVDFRVGFSDAETSFDAEIKKPILLWINDGLMAAFFFLIGLEVKREFMAGELASKQRALLPILAAIGGMVVPALIFWFINRDHGMYIHGWAIPAATDIAFALGVLALLGRRAPLSLKILLTAIAVIDDIGAILIIALFYSHDILFLPLYFAAAALLLLFLLNHRNVCALTPYILLTVFLWVCVLESGIHATMAGVIAALFVPMKDKRDPERGASPLKIFEHHLHPWVAYGVLPLFAFANAGVPLAGFGFESLAHPVTLGIICGLFFGKQIGVFAMLFLASVTRIAPKPADVSWRQLYAVSVLCGIGFTMSLFIGSLAYESQNLEAAVRMGVLLASLLSAVIGFLLLRFGGKVSPTVNE